MMGQKLAAGLAFVFSDGLILDADRDAVVIDLATNSGLAADANGLTIDLVGNSGLELTASGLGIDLVGVDCGLELTAGGLGVKLEATAPGLEFSTGLRVKLSGATLSLAAGGLSVTAPEGRWAVSGVQTTTYGASLGELVRADPSGGAFTVNLPASAAGNAGRMILVKNVSASANTITIARAGADTIDGGASVGISLAYGAVRLVDTGAGSWLVV